MKKIKKYIKNKEHDSLKSKLKSYSALAASFIALGPNADALAQCPTDVDPDVVLDNATLPIDFDGDGTIDVTFGNFNIGSPATPSSTYAGGFFNTTVGPYFSLTGGGSYYILSGAGLQYYFYTFNSSGFSFNAAYLTLPPGNGILGGFNPTAAGADVCPSGTFDIGGGQLNTAFTSNSNYGTRTVTSFYSLYNVYTNPSFALVFSTYTFYNVGSNTNSNPFITSSQNGNFTGATEYVGVQFDIGGATHYGWVELEIDPNTSEVTVLSYGYNPTAGECIPAGQCVGACDADNGTPAFVSP